MVLTDQSIDVRVRVLFFALCKEGKVSRRYEGVEKFIVILRKLWVKSNLNNFRDTKCKLG